MNDQIIGARDTHLPPEDLDLVALRDHLLEQRLFRQEQLRQIAATARSDAPPGQPAASQAEVRVQLAASARMVLADVDAALVRMDEGGYGVCGLCRRPIESERLAIVPQARHCTRCQQAREAGR
ncbi:TraR/DksA family transcriptional regulator [Streptomyces sp. NPDC057950]|uniref:TraR/DksA family transcriptional regulator n=1 Tax=Streptomyces sp. NPDC057950 TaxID=3346288 RepID=UPI0036E6F34D